MVPIPRATHFAVWSELQPLRKPIFIPQAVKCFILRQLLKTYFGNQKKIR